MLPSEREYSEIWRRVFRWKTNDVVVGTVGSGKQIRGGEFREVLDVQDRSRNVAGQPIQRSDLTQTPCMNGDEFVRKRKSPKVGIVREIQSMKDIWSGDEMESIPQLCSPMKTSLSEHHFQTESTVLGDEKMELDGIKTETAVEIRGKL